MNQKYDDLRSLYRAAAREERPTRADRRAVRAAILGAGVTAVTLHASTAAGKLISIIPGGAKVLTIGQVVAYAGLGVAVGGGLAAVGAAVGPSAPFGVSSATSLASVGHGSARNQVQKVAPVASIEPEPEATETEPDEFVAEPAPSQGNPASVEKPMPAQSGAPLAARLVPTTKSAVPGAPVLAPPAFALAAPPPPAPVAAEPPSLVEESRGLATVQTALAARDFKRALALLDVQDRDYRAGNLGQERAAARVLALCSAGRNAEAGAARERFIASFPGSPLIRRINAACKK